MNQKAGSASALTVVLIGVFWGANWPAVKFMLTELPPFTIRAVAFPIAAILLAVIATTRGHSLLPARRDWLAIAVTGMLVVFGFNVLVTLGQVLTETSKAAIIAFTMPALTAALAVVFLGDRLSVVRVMSLFAGMAGLGVLASEDFAALLAEPLGPAIMLLAALSWALGTIAMKSRQWSVSPLVLTVWFFVVASIACWPLVLIFEPLHTQTWPSLPIIATMTYHVLGPMVICYALWTAMLDRLPATVAALATLMTPVVGVTASVALLDDTLTWQKVLALLLILVSIGLTLLPDKQARS
ncbi:MAG: DMT family transporter [Burkholderiaceae bacterium]